ncbi:hypothetical protein vseg_008881 [Gypsophila vaccaria]
MAREAAAAAAAAGAGGGRPWFMEAVPLIVVLLIAAHLIALVYWIFRLATEKQQLQHQPLHSFRRKEH